MLISIVLGGAEINSVINTEKTDVTSKHISQRMRDKIDEIQILYSKNRSNNFNTGINQM